MAEHKLRILVLEDNLDDYEAIQRLLTQFCLIDRIELSCRSCLSEIIAETKLNSYDLILADLNVTDSRGIDTYLRLRDELKKELPIYILNGYSELEVVNQCIAAGANGYINKKDLYTKVLADFIEGQLHKPNALTF